MATDHQRYDEAMRKGAQFAWDNDWAEAIAQFEIARVEHPDDPVAHARLGQAYMELADYTDALRFYQQAARLDPTDVVTLGHVADVFERTGQHDQAARTYMAVAEIHLRARSLDRAISNWERAARLDPGLLGARQRLVIIYQKQGRLRDSIREHLALARIYQARRCSPGGRRLPGSTRPGYRQL